jgi:hypothetical protein
LLGVIRCEIGGAKRDRTADLLVANEALSQLSYSPTKAETNFTILQCFVRSVSRCTGAGTFWFPLFFRS